jgi:hypothetical protein
MQGFITEHELTQANQEFPGIADYFATLSIKPRTFLELVARFDHWIVAKANAGSAEDELFGCDTRAPRYG